MNLQELKEAVEAKTVEFETAMADGKPNGELMILYRELKELKSQLVRTENIQTKGSRQRFV